MEKQARDTKNSSFHKAMILALINEKGSQTITQLADYLKVSRPTIYGHLEVLESRNLITRSKDDKKKGAPVTISLTKKADPVSLNNLEKTKTAWDKITNL